MPFKNQFVKFLRESGVPVPEEEVEVEKKDPTVEGLPGERTSTGGGGGGLWRMKSTNNGEENSAIIL
jgi:hypothetical protein